MKALQKSNIYLTSFGIFVGSFALAFLVSSSFTASENSSADTIYAELDGTGYIASVSSADTIDLSLSTTPSGASMVAKDTINVKTNAPSGYKLYLSSNQYADYDSTHPGNALYQDGNSTSSYFISPTTGTISSPANLMSKNNSWGVSLTGELGDFFAAPLKTSPATIASKSSATSNSGDNLDVYYGLYANSALPSGTYIGTVNYAVLPETTYSNVDVMAVYPDVAETNTNTELTIATSLYTNYNFEKSEIIAKIGNNYCGAQDIDTSTGALTFTCITPKLTAGNYNVTVSIPKFDKTYTGSITVHSIPEFFKISTMQEMTADICASATTPSTSATAADTTGVHAGDTAYVPQHTLYDIRDGENYRIRKLADGNCWMTENLRLVLSTAEVLTQNDTSVLANWTPGNDTQTTTGVAWGTVNPDCTASCWLDATYLTANEIDTSRSYNSAMRMNPVRTLDGDSQNPGIVYNFYAATAGTGGASVSSGAATSSICPKNWQLPPSSGDKSFDVLWAKYLPENWTTPNHKYITVFPVSIVGGGDYSWQNGAINGMPLTVRFWTSDVVSEKFAYHAYTYVSASATGNYLSRVNNFPKAYGHSIRCVNK